MAWFSSCCGPRIKLTSSSIQRMNAINTLDIEEMGDYNESLSDISSESKKTEKKNDYFLYTLFIVPYTYIFYSILNKNG